MLTLCLVRATLPGQALIYNGVRSWPHIPIPVQGYATRTIGICQPAPWANRRISFCYCPSREETLDYYRSQGFRIFVRQLSFHRQKLESLPAGNSCTITGISRIQFDKGEVAAERHMSPTALRLLTTNVNCPAIRRIFTVSVKENRLCCDRKAR